MDLLWITNIATPYTVPVWQELGKLTDLHVACLAETEANRRWNVDLGGVPTTVLNARSVRVGTERTFYAPTRGMLALFRRRPALVVLDGWESPAFWQARLLAKWFGVRVVHSYWSTGHTHLFSSGPVAAFRSWLFRTADGVVTPGPASTEAVIAMGVPADRITTGFATVDVELFAAGVRSVRADANDDENARTGHHFVFVGQLIDRKNVDALLRAFARVRRSGDTLTVVGTGPLAQNLKLLASALGIDETVHFRGHLDGPELIDVYGATQTLVLPSREDVWGLVINEAIAAGLQTVVTNTCGAASAVDGLSTAFICDPTVDGLAGAMADARENWTGYYAETSTAVGDWTPSAMAKVIMSPIMSR